LRWLNFAKFLSWKYFWKDSSRSSQAELVSLFMLLVVAGRSSSFCRWFGAQPGCALGGNPSRLALEALLLAVLGRLLPPLSDPSPKSSSRFTRVRATPSKPDAFAETGCPCPPVSSAFCHGRGGPAEPAVDGLLAGADVGLDPRSFGQTTSFELEASSSGAGGGRRAPAVLGREQALLGGWSAGGPPPPARFVRPPPTRSCRRPPMPAAPAQSATCVGAENGWFVVCRKATVLWTFCEGGIGTTGKPPDAHCVRRRGLQTAPKWRPSAAALRFWLAAAALSFLQVRPHKTSPN
jgi:hypothetical protein